MMMMLFSYILLTIMMSTCYDIMEMPNDYSRMEVEALLKEEKFKDFTLKVSHGSVKGDNYLGEIFRVVVNGTKDDGTEDSINLIIKMAPQLVKLREHLNISIFYKRECFVYTRMLPMLNEIQHSYNLPEEDRFRCVKFYKGITEEYNEMLIMEDLASSSFRMYDRFKSYDKDHLSLCIKMLARYHATTLVLREKHPEKYAECCEVASEYKEFGESMDNYLNKSKSTAMKLIENGRYREKINSVFENISDELKRCLDSKNSAPYNVLCHGDCWSNNLQFKYHGNKVVDMRFLDWQIMREASPITDIYYMIFTGTDRKTRNECYEEMLDLYYATLSSNLTKMEVDISKCFPESVYRQHIKEYAVYGLIMCIGVLPLTQSSQEETPDLMNLIDTKSVLDISGHTSIRLKEVLEDYVDYGLV